MKKFGLFFIVLLLVLMTIAWAAFASSKTFFNIVYIDSLSEAEDKVQLCLVNEDNMLEVVNVNIPKQILNADYYQMIINCYDRYRNVIPSGYTTPVVNNIDITKVEKNDKTLHITVKKIDRYTNVMNLLTCWMWTFQNYAIDMLKVNINNQLYTLNRNCTINASINTIGDVKDVFYYQTDNGYIPITYFYSVGNAKVQTLINSVIKYCKIRNVDIKVDVSDTIYVYFEDYDNNITKDIIKQICFNMEMTGNNKYVIVKNGIIVKEA